MDTSHFELLKVLGQGSFGKVILFPFILFQSSIYQIFYSSIYFSIRSSMSTTTRQQDHTLPYHTDHAMPHSPHHAIPTTLHHATPHPPFHHTTPLHHTTPTTPHFTHHAAPTTHQTTPHHTRSFWCARTRAQMQDICMPWKCSRRPLWRVRGGGEEDGWNGGGEEEERNGGLKRGMGEMGYCWGDYNGYWWKWVIV